MVGIDVFGKNISLHGLALCAQEKIVVVNFSVGDRCDYKNIKFTLTQKLWVGQSKPKQLTSEEDTLTHKQFLECMDIQLIWPN